MKIIDAETVFNNYVGFPLVGAYDIYNKTITLFPCMPKKMTLYQNSKGIFTKGFKVMGANKHGEPLTKHELAEANGKGYAPRYLFSADEGVELSLSGDKYVSSHEYLTRLMDLSTLKQSENLRGFTVTKKSLDEKPVFDWKSGFLNSPRDEKGNIQRIHGCPMNNPIIQTEIESIIDDWDKALTSGKNKIFLRKPSYGFHFFYKGEVNEDPSSHSLSALTYKTAS